MPSANLLCTLFVYWCSHVYCCNTHICSANKKTVQLYEVGAFHGPLPLSGWRSKLPHETIELRPLPPRPRPDTTRREQHGGRVRPCKIASPAAVHALFIFTGGEQPNGTQRRPSPHSTTHVLRSPNWPPFSFCASLSLPPSVSPDLTRFFRYICINIYKVKNRVLVRPRSCYTFRFDQTGNSLRRPRSRRKYSSGVLDTAPPASGITIAHV